MYRTIQVSESDGVGRITLARADKLNAITLELTQELARAAASLDRPDVKVVVLTGLGNAFSVGGDIAHFLAHRTTLHAEVMAMATAFHEGILTLQRMRAPLVVGVNGTAAGGGFSLVCGADLAIAKRSAKLAAAYTRSGSRPTVAARGSCRGSWVASGLSRFRDEPYAHGRPSLHPRHRHPRRR